MSEFRMPALGAEMEAGTLVEWLKQPGDAVTRGDIIAVVDTEKGAIEIEIYEDGVIERLLVQPGEKVPVGTVLAHLAGGPAAAEPAGARSPAGPAASPAAESARPPPGRAEAALRAAPGARKLAAESGIDLATVQGTGPDGAITRADVERAVATARSAGPAPPGAAAPPAPREDRAAAMRRAIAAAMSRSKREIPHFYLETALDMSRPLAWVAAENERRAVTDRLLPAVLLVKAVALALAEVPELSGYWIDGAFRPGDRRHIGWAISLRGGGLVAPALRDADRRDLDALMRDLRDLVGRARAGTLRSSELSDPTITVTSLGEQGVESVYGIIYPPQVALIGAGRVLDRPWAADGTVLVRPVQRLTLSADHRAVDGHRAGLFLAAVERRLQQPETL